jgi:type IV pilus assembly protein PilB
MALRSFDLEVLEKMVTAQLIKREDIAVLTEEEKDTGKTLTELILSHGFIDEHDFVSFLGREFGAVASNPNLFIISEEVIQKVPAPFACRHRVVPISFHDNVLTVAMENPSDLDVIDDLKAITNMRIRPAIALTHQILIALQRYYPQGEIKSVAKPEETIEELVRIVQETKAQESEVKTVDLLKQAQETPVIKIANLLLIDAIRRRASDLFVEPWEKTMRVRCRVDGLLEEMQSPPKSMGAALVSRFKVMSQLDIAERRIPQDGRFKVKVQNREIDVRVSILPTSFGEKVCLRILDKKAQAQSLDKLGFTADDLVKLKACALKPHGMILVTGPTGSGKTTTLYATLKFLDSPTKNITTVEDPVEYQVFGINQVNVRDAIGLTFPIALRSILRQDPNIILIGEIRDLTTMDIAIKSALTGHLVLSTLHTNDTASSIIRILNMGIEPFLITSSILMISAQRLVRKLCQVCKTEFSADAELVQRLNLEKGKNYVFYRPAGCGKCRSTGYAGRSVISELLVFSPEIKAAIMKSQTAEDIKRISRKQGMKTLRESGIVKALAGETSLDEVLRVTAGDQDIEVE